jgi:hypothetical protein
MVKMSKKDLFIKSKLNAKFEKRNYRETVPLEEKSRADNKRIFFSSLKFTAGQGLFFRKLARLLQCLICRKREYYCKSKSSSTGLPNFICVANSPGWGWAGPRGPHPRPPTARRPPAGGPSAGSIPLEGPDPARPLPPPPPGSAGPPRSGPTPPTRWDRGCGRGGR